jgi:phosphoglycolate phosphatase
MINAIIFDFDGTIADDIRILIRIFQEKLKNTTTKKITLEKVNDLRDYPINYLLKEINLSNEKISDFINEIFTELNSQILEASAFEGIRSSLLSLKEHDKKIAIVTSNQIANVKSFLEKNNLDFFDCIDADEPVFGKDYAIGEFLRREKINLKNAVYIGDEIRDIDAARKVGIQIASVCWGFNTEKSLRGHKPDYLLKNPTELLKVLK